MLSGWTWLFQRITAFFLILVLGVHFWILHYQNPGEILVYADAARRLQTALFLTVDSLLLAFGLFHALNGLHNVLEDFNVRSRSITFVLLLVGVGLFIMGIYSLWQFV
ncbi:hypothetical protein G7K71_17770 [Desulfofundulus sp. TPOSR]|nr:succinate dehydrogenase membrane subunit [Desulfofundulus sp. TPOSR]AEG16737.1 succinate dehydrogenase membrane subunit [Desulfofundulus kuznetsovii DSM 6115]NHM28778.1 hypothetical protein [Desulfofundulus sp. TPOSR]